MKKLVAVIAIALVVAAAVWIAVRVELSRRVVTVPELLPKRTLFLVHAPDLSRSRERWHQSALYQIWTEPAVQSWLRKPLQQLPKSEQNRQTLDEFLALRPTRVFLALTSIENNEPKLIGGFRFEAAPAEVRKFVAAREAKWWPKSLEAERETITYGQHRIEKLQAARLEFARVVDEHWFFAANDLATLKALLDRADRRTEKAEVSLKKNEAFVAAMKHLPADHAAMVFLDPQPFVEKLLPLLTITGQALPAAQLERLKSVRSLAAAFGFDHAQMRETDFVAMPRLGAENKLTRTLLSAAGKETFFYSISQIHWSDEFFPVSAAAATGLSALIGQFSAALSSHGLKAADLQAAFGEQLEVIAQWPEQTTWPSLVAALPVRDAARARKTAEALTSIEIGAAWTRTTKNGVTLYSAQPFTGLVPLSLVIGVTDKMLFAGTNDDAVEAAIVNTGPPAGELEKSAVFRDAAAQVPAAETAFNYVDTKLLFERLDAAIRPLLTVSATIYPGLRDTVDLAKLPPAEAITKHLSPIVMSQRYASDGYVSESVGPVTFREATLAVAVGLGASFVYLGEGLKHSGLLSLPPANQAATPSPPPMPAPSPSSSPTPTPSAI